MIITDISGCEYHDLMLVINFNMDIQYVGVISCSFDNILNMCMIRGNR